MVAQEEEPALDADADVLDQQYRVELDHGAVEVRLIAYPERLTDRAAINLLIAAQADVLIEIAAKVAAQGRP